MNYRIPFIRNSYIRFAAKHKIELIDAFWRCVEKGDLILREDVSEFENNLAQYVGTEYGIGVGSGTDALFLSLKALGIGPGDEVITVSHTFIASIQAIVHCGATPVLIDVGPDELMDVRKIIPAITEKTKAIIPVHFHGKVCDMDTILTIANDFNLKVVEDAAQALGSSQITNPLKGEMKWKRAGSFGDLGCFSFNTPKLLGAFGDAGGIVTNNRELAEKLYLLRNHWNMAQTSVRMDDFPTPDTVQWAWKSRLDNIQAALLLVKFKYFDEFLKRRKEIADMYLEGLKDLPITLPTYGPGDVIQEFIIRVKDTEERVSLKEFMDNRGIELLIRETTPNHKIHDLGLSHFDLPVTETISDGAVRLPAYPEMYDSEVEEIIQALKDFYATGR